MDSRFDNREETDAVSYRYSLRLGEKKFVMKNGWTNYFQVTFKYRGIEFSCNSSILVGKEGKPIEVSIFDIKPAEEGLKQAAKEAALKTLETHLEK